MEKLITTEEIGALACGTKFCDASGGHFPNNIADKVKRAQKNCK